MNITFFVKAFFTGFCAASAFGPVFIMTFNRAVLCGTLLGVATALGAALTDGVMFFLAMSGMLATVSTYKGVLLSLDLIGAMGLWMLGIHYWNTTIDVKERLISACPSEFITCVWKTFVMTMLNPSALFFFMFISMRLFADAIGNLPPIHVLGGSLAVSSGTFCSLSLVSLGAATIGARLTGDRLKLLSQITGVVLCAIAVFLFYDAAVIARSFCRI